MKHLGKPKRFLDIIDSVPLYFHPGAANVRSFCIAYRIKTLDAGAICRSVFLENGACHIFEGIAENAELVICATEEDYLRIALGKLDLEFARWSGNIKYCGNNLLHLELNTYLRLPKWLKYV